MHIISTKQNPYSTKIVDEVSTLQDLGLDWGVQKQPLVALLDGRYPTPIESHVSIHRDDNNQSLGVVGSTYEPIQNSKMWEGLHQSLEGIDYKICGGGYVNQGKNVLIQAEVGDDTHTINGDKFNNFVTFYSSHDGSSALTLYDTSIRVICQNTLSLSRAKGGKQIKLSVRHTRNASIHFDNLLSSLEAMFKHRQEVYTKLDDLGGNVFTHDKMIEWATSFFNKANKLSSVSSNKAHEAVRLAKVGVGNRGQTAYDMFNGVTELLTHGDRSGKEKTFRSSEFGTHAKYKADALESLHNPTAVADHIERGSRLLTYGELV